MNPTINQKGYTLAGALTLIAVMSILMALAVESWEMVKRRDNELELMFRGKEYAEAIGRYQQKYGAYPPDIETLLKLKLLRREYKDPMTESGKWKILHPDSLVQLGLAGQTAGGKENPNDGKDKKKKKKKDQGTSDFGSDEQQTRNPDNDEQKEDDTGLVSGEEENEDEEPEVESTGPVVGVVSRSKKDSIKTYNNQTKYNRWYFVFALQQNQPVPQPPNVNPRDGRNNNSNPPKNNPPPPDIQDDDNE